MPERPFHERLSRHLDLGTRPGLTVSAAGDAWTAAAFGKTVGAKAHTVRNWRSGHRLPNEQRLGFILDALFGTDLSLTAARAELREAWDIAHLQRQVAATRQHPAGLPIVERDDHFAIDHTPRSSDHEAAGRGDVQQQHAVALDRLAKLEALVRRRHNALTDAWSDLLPTVTALHARLARPIECLPDEMAWFYQDALSVGSLLEQDANLIARPEAGESPLSVDLQRVLADAVGATALLVRCFPSNQERDRQYGMFWSPDGFAAARAVKACASDVLRPEDDKLLERMERTATRPGVQGEKAKRGFIATMGNIVLAGSVSLILGGYANESPFIKRVSRFLVQVEGSIGTMLGSLPADMGAAIRFGLDLAKDLPTPAAPPATPRVTKKPPDFSADEVRRMILEGQRPPAAWAPFIDELDLEGTGVTELSPLSGLVSLERLGLRGTGVTELSPLSGLISLEWLGLQMTGVTELSPLSSLTRLESLNLSGTRVAELRPLSKLNRLKSLNLNRTRVAELRPLSNLTSLEFLDLRGTSVTELSPISDLTRLERLMFSETSVTELSPLAGLTSLEALNLLGTGVTDLSPLSGLTSLKGLNLRRTGVTELSPLSGLASLRSLNLRETGVTELSPLSGLTSLEWLDLQGTGVTELSPLAGLTRLKSLNLGAKGVTALSSLSGLTRLESLHLEGSGVKDLKELLPLSGLTQLIVFINGQKIRPSQKQR